MTDWVCAITKTGTNHETKISPESGIFDEGGSRWSQDVISCSGDVERASEGVAVVDGDHVIPGGNTEQRRIHEHVVAQSPARHSLLSDHATFVGGACCRDDAVGRQ